MQLFRLIIAFSLQNFLVSTYQSLEEETHRILVAGLEINKQNENINKKWYNTSQSQVVDRSSVQTICDSYLNEKYQLFKKPGTSEKRLSKCYENVSIVYQQENYVLAIFEKDGYTNKYFTYIRSPSIKKFLLDINVYGRLVELIPIGENQTTNLKNNPNDTIIKPIINTPKNEQISTSYYDTNKPEQQKSISNYFPTSVKLNNGIVYISWYKNWEKNKRQSYLKAIDPMDDSSIDYKQKVIKFDFDDDVLGHDSALDYELYNKPSEKIYFSKIWAQSERNFKSSFIQCSVEEINKKNYRLKYELYCQINDYDNKILIPKFLIDEDVDKFQPIFSNSWFEYKGVIFRPDILYYVKNGCLYYQVIEFKDVYHLAYFPEKLTDNREQQEKFILTNFFLKNEGKTNIIFALHKDSKKEEEIGVIIHCEKNAIRMHLVEKSVTDKKIIKTKESAYFKRFHDDEEIVSLSYTDLYDNGRFLQFWSHRRGTHSILKMQVFQYKGENWIGKNVENVLYDDYDREINKNTSYIGLLTTGNFQVALDKINPHKNNHDDTELLYHMHFQNDSLGIITLVKKNDKNIKEIKIISGEKFVTSIFEKDVFAVKNSENTIIGIYNAINFSRPQKIFTSGSRKMDQNVCVNRQKQVNFLGFTDEKKEYQISRCCFTEQDMPVTENYLSGQKSEMKKKVSYSPLDKYERISFCQVECQPQLDYCYDDYIDYMLKMKYKNTCDVKDNPVTCKHFSRLPDNFFDFKVDCFQIAKFPKFDSNGNQYKISITQDTNQTDLLKYDLSDKSICKEGVLNKDQIIIDNLRKDLQKDDYIYLNFYKNRNHIIPKLTINFEAVIDKDSNTYKNFLGNLNTQYFKEPINQEQNFTMKHPVLNHRKYSIKQKYLQSQIGIEDLSGEEHIVNQPKSPHDKVHKKYQSDTDHVKENRRKFKHQLTVLAFIICTLPIMLFVYTKDCCKAGCNSRRNKMEVDEIISSSENAIILQQVLQSMKSDEKTLIAMYSIDWESKCVVCQKKIDKGSKVIEPCQHYIHKECLKHPEITEGSCPLCSSSIYEIKPLSQKKSEKRNEKVEINEPSHIITSGKTYDSKSSNNTLYQEKDVDYGIKTKLSNRNKKNKLSSKIIKDMPLALSSGRQKYKKTNQTLDNI